MTHYYPGLEGEKSEDLGEDEIAIKISELNKRIGIAYTTGRTESIYQLRQLVEHYQIMMREKFMKEEQEMIDADPKLGRTVINIEWPDPADEDEKDKF